ncbi:hypothetical protein AMECASPLE_011428 [Ameca splendens]|uniref:Uncharacterized protein n=1 Tax=Ameca splendens TaxID=208324 RepID=A0ABV1A981_9TELE
MSGRLPLQFPGRADVSFLAPPSDSEAELALPRRRRLNRLRVVGRGLVQCPMVIGWRGGVHPGQVASPSQGNTETYRAIYREQLTTR